MVWLQVEKALDEIISDYEKVNHVISLYQDDKIRNIGLVRVGRMEGIGLELGNGPGNFTPRILDNLKGELVCLDYSDKMIDIAKKKLVTKQLNYIRGVFEYLPLRSNVIDVAIMSFSLRDSHNKSKVINEVEKTLTIDGKFLIIDIGKPNNRILMTVFSLYLKFIVPLFSGLLTGRGIKNQWSLLYKTYQELPQNRSLEKYLKDIFYFVYWQDFVFGGLVIVLATNNMYKTKGWY